MLKLHVILCCLWKEDQVKNECANVDPVLRFLSNLMKFITRLWEYLSSADRQCAEYTNVILISS